MTFHSLVTHDGAGGKQAPELMMQSLATIFLLRCLKAKNFYSAKEHGSSSPLELSETEIYLAKLIHHFMRVTYYNTHEITTTDEDLEGEFGLETLKVEG